MNLNFQSLIPQNFPDTARVWIYQSNRAFTVDESINIQELLHNFSNTWLSHGAKVKGFGNLLFGQFIIIMADETATGVSGCSTDSSVKLIRTIEEDHSIQLLDRTSLAFVVNERIQLIHLSQLEEAKYSGILSAETIYFNNNIQTKEALLHSWIIPIKDSWLAKRFTALESK